MIIKKITMTNFRQYVGTQSIEFSTDREKNVTVIIGKNTYGKTTIVQAFNWCLYGTCDGFKNQDLLNYEVARTMGLYSVQTVGVEIELIHENRLYVIRRSQLVRKTDFDKIKNESPVLKIEYKEENGEMQQESEYGCLSRINKILPQALSGYFFFDGEHISDINNKKDVVAAVRGLMGLDVISAAVDDLNPSKASSVVSKLRGELDVGQDAKSERMKTDLAAQKGKLEFLQKQLKDTEDEIAFFEDRKKELEAKILANADTKNRQEERTRIERDIQFLERTQEALETQLVKEFSKNTYKFFAYPLYQKLLDIIAEAKKDGEGIPEMHSKAIDFILSRGKCICGCDLTENQGAVRHIKYEQSLLPPEHIGTTVRKYKEESQRNSLIFEEFADQIRSTYIRMRENANQLDEKRSYLLELSRLLQGNVDVGKFERDNQENERQLRDRRNKAMSLAVQIGECNNRIKSLETSIEGLVVANKKNEKINKCIAYAVEIYNYFKNSYDEAEKEVKTELQESISKFFAKMYHGKRIIEIDDQYHIRLMIEDEDGSRKLDTSPGLDTVKNFAFVCGLVDLARRKAQGEQNAEDGAVNYSTEPYPIVMDAPFSSADETHISNISKVLPIVAEQVIMIVMRKDWGHASAEMMDKVGMMYEIEKASETSSSLRRVQ